MTAQKITNILYDNGYTVTKNQNGYQTASYTIRYNNEIIYHAKNTNDLKTWFSTMNDRYNYTYNNNNIPSFDLNGMPQ